MYKEFTIMVHEDAKHLSIYQYGDANNLVSMSEVIVQDAARVPNTVVLDEQSADVCPGCGEKYTGLCGNCSRENTRAILRS